MKKIAVFISLAVLLVAACTKEAAKPGPEDKWADWDEGRYLTGFSMHTEQAEQTDTKATINFSNGAITWNSGDKVLVYVPASGNTARYNYNGTYFEPEATPLEIGANEAYAYYPADAYSISAGKVTLTIPESVTADPGNKLPMGGYIPAGGIPSGKERREGAFKSLGSIIWVKLTAVAGKEETLSGVVLENTSLALAGKGKVTWSGATPSLSALDGGKSIEVASTKKLSTSTPAEFFLFAPAGSMEGLTLTVNFKEEAAHFKPFTQISRNGPLALARNQVLPIEWSVDGYKTGVSAKGEPIVTVGGKVLFFVEIPAEGSAIRDALGYDGDSLDGYSVYVNGTKYDVLTNKGGEAYIEVAENPEGKYEAYLVTDESQDLYGTLPTKDVVLPFSQFYGTTKADFKNYPRYARYTAATGNVLSFKEAVALINLKMLGSVKLASVKVRALGGETLSGRADYSYTSGVFSPKESLSEAVVNCTYNGNFVPLGAEIPIFIAPGTFTSGLEITAVTDKHLVMHKTLTPGTIAAGTVYAPSLEWKADDNVLFFEGFDNFVWGGNIMAGSSGFGYAPDASAMTYTGGRARDGYARAYTKVNYNEAGTGYMQSDRWDDVKEATVASSHVLQDSYYTSRNLTDWTILYRAQEYQGVLALGTAETKRGVMKTPFFKNVAGTCDVVLSFDVCLQTGNTKGIQFQIHNGGHFESCTVNGVNKFPKTYQYKNTYAEAIFNDNLMTPASSAAAAKTWHHVELSILGATDASTVDFRSVTASGATLGMWVDNIKVTKVPGTEKKGNLRILYWNIQNGMWWDQGNNYDNFVAFVKKYDPDICVWCEAESIYTTGTANYAKAADRYLYYTRPNNWTTLAKRYGHSYTQRGGRTDEYPQEITSKYPITLVQALTSGLTHGAGHFQITVAGTRLNIVTTHPYPQNCNVGNHTTEAQKTSDNRRLSEMKTIVSNTFNNSKYASESNWMLIGDFNSNSPQDCWFGGYDRTNIAFAPQQYLLDNTDLQDVLYDFWNADDLCTFCSTTLNATDRKDNIYASPGIFDQVQRAIVVNDQWTYNIVSLGISNFKSPSDHRPILVDIAL
ncbi:MAG: metal-dependent hydrolase [Bacteroidales bacterium]|nr:metal-dependent hydrolase [Bacteroidales bacterium]